PSPVSLGGALNLDGHAAEAIDQTHVATRRPRQLELLVAAVSIAPQRNVGAGGLRPVSSSRGHLARGGVLVVIQDLAGVPILQPVVPVARVDEPPLLVGPAMTRPL